MTKIIPADLIGQNVELVDTSPKTVDIQSIVLRNTTTGVQTLRNVETLISQTVQPTGISGNLITETMWVIDTPLSKNYLPSRVWFDSTQQAYIMLYYTIPGVQMPRFTDDNEKVYCFAVRIDPHAKYSYDMRARIFIDQINVNGEMHCFFVFSTEDYDKLIKTNNIP